MTDYKDYLRQFKKNLNVLEERKAKYAGNAPLELLNQIEDHESAITLTEQALAGELTEAEWREALKPLLLAVREGQVLTIEAETYIAEVQGDVVSGDKNVFLTYIQNIPRRFMLAIGAAVLILIGLGITNLQPVQVALFPTATPTATATPTSTPTPTPGPDRMPADSFNVAIAEIGRLDAQGQVQGSADGQRISEWIYSELQREYENSEVLKERNIKVWHDSLGPAEKSVELGTIGSDEAAEGVAKKINANLVIYGNLDTGQNPATFEPRFYVSRLRGEADEIDEITGPFQLGSSIPVELPLDKNDQVTITSLRQQVALRALAMRWFTIGFIWDLLGNTKKALETFKQAEADLTEWANKGEGKEILYYFIGREALTLARDEQAVQNSGTFESAEAARTEAERYFQKALGSNAGYAKAHIGLAGVYYQRAQLQPSEQRLALPDMDQAIDHYQQGLDYALESPSGLVEFEARFGLAIAARLKGLTYRDLGFPDEAEVYFDWAGRELAMILKPLADEEQQRTLAQAYLALGVTYSEQARLQKSQGDIAAGVDLFKQAEEAYAGCIAQGDPAEGGNPHDLLLKDIIATYCQPYRQRVTEDRLALEGNQ